MAVSSMEKTAMQLLDHLLPPPARFPLFGRRAPATIASAGRARPSELQQNRLFLHVRSVSADGFEHLFQFALVDDAGNVTVSVFARGRTAVEGDGPAAPSPIPAVDWSELAATLAPSCRGAALVAFGRVLHGSFLPAAIRDKAAGLDCARARFVKAARRAGIKVGPGDVLDLNDARGLIGLPPVRSPDAALRALGLRELWRWMDEQDQAGRALSQNRGDRS